jgi:phosphoglycolate phosphatase
MDRYDGIIFDVDGTLWDATPGAAISYNKVFEREGYNLRVTADQLKTLFGKTMDVVFEILLPELPKEEQIRLANASIEQEDEDLLTTPGTCYPEILETFQKLSQKYPLFIVSNCQCGYIERLIETAGIEAYVKAHLCYGETGTTKGQTILRLMREQGLKHPVYVGDIQGDADACAEAGIPIIYASYGYGHVKDPVDTILELKELQKLAE